MNWIKQNPFYTALGLITLLACAGAAYFVIQTKGKYDAVAMDYEDEARELQRLQALHPFPEKANETRVAEQLEAYEDRADAFMDRLQEFNIEVEAITPGEFQQRLLDSVNQIKNQSQQLNVGLPEGFFLGFPEYETSLPNNEATSVLLVQMKAVQQVVDLLLQNRVSEIKALSRQKVELIQPEKEEVKEEPERRSRRRASARREADAEEEEAKPELLNSEAIERIGFDIAFTSQHSDFENILNQITTLDHFLVIRAVEVQNERPQGPLRGVDNSPNPGIAGGPEGAPEDDLLSVLDGEKPTGESQPPAGEGAEGDIDSLNFVFGQEKITVTLHVELLQFEEMNVEEEKQTRASRNNRRTDS